jgi:hypothetical protein
VSFYLIPYRTICAIFLRKKIAQVNRSRRPFFKNINLVQNAMLGQAVNKAVPVSVVKSLYSPGASSTIAIIPKWIGHIYAPH